MIPKTITREHVLRAVEEIDNNGVPAGRQSTKFGLFFNGKQYPPKYVLSLAHRFAEGHELDSSAFGGGQESNAFLASLGFQINGPSQSDGAAVRATPTRSKQTRRAVSRGTHNERCPACKDAVRNLLEKLYGEIETNPRFELATKPEGLNHARFGEVLSSIYKLLQDHRGFYEFAKSENLPNCDWYVRQPGFVVEFDESQHFTKSRAIALERYPSDLPLGFDRKLWIELCAKIHAQDGDPPYRDEQRAWYDTLRDFLPAVRGLAPTVRLYAGETQWCDLDPTNAGDVETFRQMLSRKLPLWSVELRSDPNPEVARIIMDGDWDGNVRVAHAVLDDVASKWPHASSVKFLITCGAFITFDWPISLPAVGNNLSPSESSLRVLEENAREKVDELLSGQLMNKLSSCTRYLTLGVDSHKSKISQTQNYIPEPHVELVCLVDLAKRTYHFSGKSYPTTRQERGLIRNPHLDSHIVDTEYGTALILGCHDLTIFNPRSKSRAKGWRRNVAIEWRKLVKDETPTFALHHPHTTVKAQTWRNAWTQLHRELPSVRLSLGSGSYSSRDDGWSKRDSLLKVLAATKHGSTLDVLVHLGTLEQ